MKNQNSIGLALLMIAVLSSCTSTGSVDTLQEDSDQPIVEQPIMFKSPLKELERLRNEVEKLENKIGLNKSDKRSKEKLTRILQAIDTLEADQASIEKTLAEEGEITLYPDRSYSFALESYCINGGTARPVIGDGLHVAPIKGDAENWIFDILKNIGHTNIEQSRIQSLIWALLGDVRFDELSTQNQNTLLEFYPDARIRFGNRQLEEMGKSFLNDFLQSKISNSLDSVIEQKNKILSIQDSYSKLTDLLAPISNRKTPIPVGWMRMKEDFFLKVTADGFSRVYVDIYNPRSTIKFKPWQWAALPSVGQRLAISARSFRKPKELSKTRCEQLKAWKPKNCQNLTDQDRLRLLDIADPSHFPNTRYQTPPKINSPIEVETDCSRFVHEVYHRAGFDFEDSSTLTFECLNVFKNINDEMSKPGDLVLYKGHIGILDESGQVISATRGGEELRSTKLPQDPNFIPSITRLKKEQAGNGSWNILRWSCP